MRSMNDFFLQLVRLGVGVSTEASLSDSVDWSCMQALAEQQGLFAIVLDGIDKIPIEQRPKKEDILQWIGQTVQHESQYAIQQKMAAKMAVLFHKNAIRTYVLKGVVVSQCYSKPEHRNSVDMDCYLLPEKGAFDAWALGNDIIKSKGFEVKCDFYKNSTFLLPGLTVENHKYMVPFRGNKCLKTLEIMLKNSLRDDKGEDLIEGTYLYRPPVMVTAMFLIEHAYSHFLHEGLTWRLVLDWMMFSKKHKKDIDWYVLDAYIDEFGFRKFYDSYHHLGKYLLGELKEKDLSKVDKRMLADVWSDLDIHETVKGVQGKWALVGNTWRARWKYHYFTDISMLQALWIQVKGFLFIKEPKLD